MTQAQIATEIAKAVAAALGQKSLNKAKPGRKVKKAKGRGAAKLTDAEKAGYMAANDAACVKAFHEKGYDDVQPRVNVMTYNKFIEAGLRVRKGEKSVRVGPFALFHVSQCDPIAQANANDSAAEQVAA